MEIGPMWYMWQTGITTRLTAMKTKVGKAQTSNICTQVADEIQSALGNSYSRTKDEFAIRFIKNQEGSERKPSNPSEKQAVAVFYNANTVGVFDKDLLPAVQQAVGKHVEGVGKPAETTSGGSTGVTTAYFIDIIPQTGTHFFRTLTEGLSGLGYNPLHEAPVRATSRVPKEFAGNLEAKLQELGAKLTDAKLGQRPISGTAQHYERITGPFSWQSLEAFYGERSLGEENTAVLIGATRTGFIGLRIGSKFFGVGNGKGWQHMDLNNYLDASKSTGAWSDRGLPNHEGNQYSEMALQKLGLERKVN